MERRFTRFRRGPVSDHPGAFEVPGEGMCLSVFLVLEPQASEGSVLMGKLNPTAPWWQIGAIDPRRLSAIGDRWMLPSSQLAFFESPDEAARRVLKEQLETESIRLKGPQVFSDPSARPDRPSADPHWDFHFVFRGRWVSDSPPRASPWKRLEFVDVARTSRSDIARSQGDVLELVGLRPKD
ncbi:MAG TPA: NUDIX hydrolase [Thermoplasmata archaeon]|nr:NUDIX hydrolase [Thermoplasmata archaeon]